MTLVPVLMMPSAYWQGYKMRLEDLKNEVHQLGVHVYNQDDIERKPELLCIQGIQQCFQDCILWNSAVAKFKFRA
jgi:hypothetical protein